MAQTNADGMLPDGTNPEGVDPVPPLNWTSKADLTDAVVWGFRISPAVCKLLAFMQYHEIPFRFKPGIGKKGAKFYKKMPVLDAGGRTVNDTFVILKHLNLALTGSFDEEWEKRITFHYQLSIVYSMSDAEAKMTFGAKNGDFPVPGFMLWAVTCFVRPGGLKKLKAAFDDPAKPETLVDLTAFAKEVKAAMGERQFVGGDQPGQVDISFYGVNCRFVFAKVPLVVNALEAAGLMEWYRRMEALIPLTGKPQAMFEKLTA